MIIGLHSEIYFNRINVNTMEQEHSVHHSGRLKFGGSTWVIGMSEVRVFLFLFLFFVVLNH